VVVGRVRSFPSILEHFETASVTVEGKCHFPCGEVTIAITVLHSDGSAGMWR